MDEQLRKELSDINAAISELRTNVKAAFRRIDEQKEMAESVHELALAIRGMQHEQEMLRKDMDEIKARSAKRWETILMEVIKLAVAVAAGAVLVRLGLG